MNKQFDEINKAAHYNQHPSGVECITVVRHHSFNIGNVIKYLWRAGLKDASIKDLKKARYYLDDEIKMREQSESNLFTPKHIVVFHPTLPKGMTHQEYNDAIKMAVVEEAKPKRKKKFRINKKAFLRK
jgi:hypothetical protein